MTKQPQEKDYTIKLNMGLSATAPNNEDHMAFIKTVRDSLASEYPDVNVIYNEFDSVFDPGTFTVAVVDRLGNKIESWDFSPKLKEVIEDILNLNHIQKLDVFRSRIYDANW